MCERESFLSVVCVCVCMCVSSALGGKDRRILDGRWNVCRNTGLLCEISGTGISK